MAWGQCTSCYRAIMRGKLIVEDGIAIALKVPAHACDTERCTDPCTCSEPHQDPQGAISSPRCGQEAEMAFGSGLSDKQMKLARYISDTLNVSISQVVKSLQRRDGRVEEWLAEIDARKSAGK